MAAAICRELRYYSKIVGTVPTGGSVDWMSYPPSNMLAEGCRLVSGRVRK